MNATCCMSSRTPAGVFFYIFLLGLSYLIISCEEPDAIEHRKRQQPSELPEIKIEEVLIDTSDLYYLPKDTGGIHTAYPAGATDAFFGYYAYTPSGYGESGHEYPLILFLHGWGERGNSKENPKILDNVLKHGPPRLINYGQWDPSYPFVVVSPQLSTDYWHWDKVHEFLDYLLETYHINRHRIYLTGLSLGGGGCWYYAGVFGDESYAAAIVPISASGSEQIIENLTKVPIWAFHGAKDDLVPAFENYGSVPLVKAINAMQPEIKAKISVYQNTGHDAWTKTYNGSGMGTVKYPYHPFDMPIYDWMLLYRKE